MQAIFKMPGRCHKQKMQSMAGPSKIEEAIQYMIRIALGKALS
jgi:hypothetical protein